MSGRWFALALVPAGCYSPSVTLDAPGASDAAQVADVPPFGCPGVLFRDDFEDGDLGEGVVWDSYVDTTSWVSEEAGHLTLGFRDLAADGALAGVSSTQIFDLRGSAIVTEVSRLVPAQTYLAADLDGANRIVIRHEDGMLAARQRVADVTVTVAERAYDPVNDRFWRIGENGGMTTFDTSPDGRGWTSLGLIANVIPLDSIVILLEIDAVALASSPGETHIELAAICPL